MTEQHTDPATAALNEIRDLVAARDGLIERMRRAAVGAAEFNAAQDRLAERVPTLIAVAETALFQHHRSSSPAEGCGSGDAHGQHYCAGVCYTTMDFHTRYEVWPCLPYLQLFAALTGQQVIDLTGTAVVEHELSCVYCSARLTSPQALDRCRERRLYVTRHRCALREAGQQT
jgi:hypothetical protein